MVAEQAPQRKRTLARNLLLLASVLGPGFVTASAGNDVGGIATYSSAGAQFGYGIIWVMLPLAVALIVVQEMATRMGCVTGKGLAALFRENFGVRISVISMLVLFLINTLLTSTEFVGIATASEIMGGSRYIAVPLALLVVPQLIESTPMVRRRLRRCRPRLEPLDEATRTYSCHRRHYTATLFRYMRRGRTGTWICSARSRGSIASNSAIPRGQSRWP